MTETVTRQGFSSDTIMIVLLAALGAAIYFAYKTGDVIGKELDKSWWCRFTGIGCQVAPVTPDPVKRYDSHGCEVGMSSWCQSLIHCVPSGLTCPPVYVPAPIVSPIPVCDLGWHPDENNICVKYPWNEPTPDIPSPPHPYTKECFWPNGELIGHIGSSSVGDPLTCAEGVAMMCARFGSGYKGCP